MVQGARGAGEMWGGGCAGGNIKWDVIKNGTDRGSWGYDMVMGYLEVFYVVYADGRNHYGH